MKNILAMVAVAGFATSAMATGTFSYSGDNMGGLMWDRPIGMGPGISGLGPVGYSVIEVGVTASGAYNFASVQDYDGYLHVYAGSFNPLDQLTGLIGANDDGVGGIGTSNIDAVALTAGTSYFVVTSAFAAADMGTFTNTIDGGPGKAFAVPAPSALALLGLGGLVAGRRRR